MTHRILLIPLLTLGQTVYSQAQTIFPDIAKPLFDFDAKKPMLAFDGEQKPNENRHLRYSAVTNYREGVPASEKYDSSIDSIQGTVRGFIYNRSIQDIITLLDYRNSDVILNVKHPEKFRYDRSQGSEFEWARKNAKCFEFMMPMGTINKIETIRDEFEYLFDVKIKVEDRAIQVLSLSRSSRKDKIKSKGIGGKSYTSGKLNNISIDFLAAAADEAGFPVKIINDTNYKANVDLDLGKEAFQNIESLRISLKKYDLQLQPSKKTFSMFVIHDK